MSTPYHEYVNKVVLNMIPKSSFKIVDFGCMGGALCREYKKSSPNSYWVGVEVDPIYAERAKKNCDEVNILDINMLDEYFFDHNKDADCWIFGDVLEHLIDPWAVVEKIRNVMKPNSSIIACVPNAQHYTIIEKLLTGNFRYEDWGLLDKTHLRWFTKTTLFEFFQNLDFEIVEAKYVYNDLPPEELFKNLYDISKLHFKHEIDIIMLGSQQFIIKAIPVNKFD